MREVTLEHREGLHVAASVRGDDGALLIRGQVSRQSPWGAEEYDYGLLVHAGDVPRVVEALTGVPGGDVLTVLSARGRDVVAGGERAWLRSIGIEPEYGSTE